MYLRTLLWSLQTTALQNQWNIQHPINSICMMTSPMKQQKSRKPICIIYTSAWTTAACLAFGGRYAAGFCAGGLLGLAFAEVCEDFDLSPDNYPKFLRKRNTYSTCEIQIHNQWCSKTSHETNLEVWCQQLLLIQWTWQVLKCHWTYQVTLVSNQPENNDGSKRRRNKSSMHKTRLGHNLFKEGHH